MRFFLFFVAVLGLIVGPGTREWARSDGETGPETAPGSRALAGYKELYDFAHWPGKDGPVRDGFRVDSSALPAGLSLASVSGVYAGEDRTKSFSVARYYEVTSETQSGSIGVRVVVTETCAQAQEQIIELFAVSQAPPSVLGHRGSEYGLSLGNICFATRLKDGNFHSAVWVRNNVFVWIWANTEDMRPFVEPLARAIDAAISKRATYSTYTECQSRPVITKVEWVTRPWGPKLADQVDWKAVEVKDPQGEKLVYWPFRRPGWPSFQVVVNESNLIGFPLSGIAQWQWESPGCEGKNADINAFLKAQEASLGRPPARPALQHLEAVALDETEMAPFNLEFQDKKGYWPYGEQDGEVLVRAGLYQYLMTKDRQREIMMKVCEFESEDEAKAAGEYYSRYVGAPFHRGGLGGGTVGQNSWASETSSSAYLIFQRGPFCLALGGSLQDRDVIMALATRADKKILGYLESERLLEALPDTSGGDPTQIPLQTALETSKALFIQGTEMSAPYMLSSGEEYAKGRRQFVVPMLKALKVLLDNGVPPEGARPELPAVSGLSVPRTIIRTHPDGRVEVITVDPALLKPYEEQMEARRKADLLFDAWGWRCIVTDNIAGYYSNPPYATEELRQLAVEILKDDTVVSALVQRVEANIARNTAGQTSTDKP